MELACSFYYKLGCFYKHARFILIKMAKTYKIIDLSA